jgi:hypothetical protein
MYRGVPTKRPRASITNETVTRAMPKLVVFTDPSLATRTFSGLRSWWTTPWLCAYASPLSTLWSTLICCAVVSREMNFRSEPRDMSSITMYKRCSTSSIS